MNNYNQRADHAVLGASEYNYPISAHRPIVGHQFLDKTMAVNEMVKIEYVAHHVPGKL